jgi:hypothetical protein
MNDRSILFLSSALGIIVAVVLVLAVRADHQRERGIERGERLFSGCPQGIDRGLTAEKGEFVCKGESDPAPFAGNGRACGSCHMPGDGFGLSVKRIPTLPPTHPLFFAGLDEDPVKLRADGLIHVIDRDEDSIDEFRQTPKLVHLRELCDSDGECVALGLLGDRETDLCQFSREAVVNHLSKTTAGVEGVDFVLPTDAECRDLIRYMRSNRVSR